MSAPNANSTVTQCLPLLGELLRTEVQLAMTCKGEEAEIFAPVTQSVTVLGRKADYDDLTRALGVTPPAISRKANHTVGREKTENLASIKFGKCSDLNSVLGKGWYVGWDGRVALVVTPPVSLEYVRSTATNRRRECTENGYTPFKTVGVYCRYEVRLRFQYVKILVQEEEDTSEVELFANPDGGDDSSDESDDGRDSKKRNQVVAHPCIACKKRTDDGERRSCARCHRCYHQRCLDRVDKSWYRIEDGELTCQICNSSCGMDESCKTKSKMVGERGIRCDGACGRWYHFECVNIYDKKAKLYTVDGQKWYCPSCSTAGCGECSRPCTDAAHLCRFCCRVLHWECIDAVYWNTPVCRECAGLQPHDYKGRDALNGMGVANVGTSRRRSGNCDAGARSSKRAKRGNQKYINEDTVTNLDEIDRI